MSGFFTPDRHRVEIELNQARRKYAALIQDIEVKLVDLQGECGNQITQLKTGVLPAPLIDKAVQINQVAIQSEEVKQQINSLEYLLGEV